MNYKTLVFVATIAAHCMSYTSESPGYNAYKYGCDLIEHFHNKNVVKKALSFKEMAVCRSFRFPNTQDKPHSLTGIVQMSPDSFQQMLRFLIPAQTQNELRSQLNRNNSPLFTPGFWINLDFSGLAVPPGPLVPVVSHERMHELHAMKLKAKEEIKELIKSEIARKKLLKQARK